MKRSLVAAALLFAGGAGAHEYWLMPSRFAAAPGERIGIEHRVGSGWPGETLPRNPLRVVRFGIVDARGERPIEGAPGADPAGETTLRAPGLTVAVYRSTPSPLVLDAAPFESYLRDEGLEQIIALRAVRGMASAPGRERFSRNAKTLVAVGDALAKAGPFDRPAGLTLELVPETDPRGIAGGGRFAVQLLYLGRPLAGALVKAIAQDLARPRIELRSDERGRVEFDLPTSGVWLVSTVHMTEAPSGGGFEWESLWSSLTFELAPASHDARLRPRRRSRPAV